MKKSILVIILLTNWILLFPQTSIPAGNVSGNWLINGSPYLIEGEISIPDGETLTIDPGVLIEFQGHYKFNVQGQLLAVGTMQDSIHFTVNDTTGFSNPNIPDGGWHGIRFDNTPTTNDSSKIVYCHLEYGKALGANPDYMGGSIFCSALSSGFSKLQITNSKISKNYAGCGGGIALYFCTVNLRNNYITKNISGNKGGGIYCRNSYLNSGSSIESNKIYHNIAFQKGGGICGTRLKVSNTLIHSNIAENGGGICIEGSSNIINCTLSENTAQLKGGGLFCTDSDMSEVYNCIIVDNNAIIEGNEIALNAYWYMIPWGYVFVPANITLEYNNIKEGYGEISLNYEGSTPQYPIIYNIIYNNNLDSNPLYIDPENQDFHLLSESPCINSGTPDTTGLNLPDFDLDGNPRIFDNQIDMGCYEWQVTGVVNEELQIDNFKLNNYPNPFNPTTTIEFSIQNDSNVELTIHNIKGQNIKIIANNEFNKGNHSIIWNGDDENGETVGSGVYLYKLNVNGNTEAVRKCLLLK